MNADFCVGFSKEEWQALSKRLDDDDDSAWEKAISVFEKRMKERFFSCIDALEKADTKPPHGTPFRENSDHCTPGFSIMAICCLLIETVQGFREEPAPGETGKHLFEKFLLLPAFRKEFEEPLVAKKFLCGIRNGILHEAETRRWVIWRDRPEGKITAPHEDGNALNRGLFYKALKSEFESYLAELRDPHNGKRRARFKKKMEDVSKVT